MPQGHRKELRGEKVSFGGYRASQRPERVSYEGVGRGHSLRLGASRGLQAPVGREARPAAERFSVSGGPALPLARPSPTTQEPAPYRLPRFTAAIRRGPAFYRRFDQ